MRLFVILAVCALSTPFVYGQSKTQIKQVNAQPTSPASGEEMYTMYCAVCHGKDGKGTGPAAGALKTRPTDLTSLAKRNGGRYPALEVQNSIVGDRNVIAHGSKDMPIWGQVFREMSGSDAHVKLRLANLTKYIEQMQAK
jgi:mono/diheme cytochrome c family protein